MRLLLFLVTLTFLPRFCSAQTLALAEARTAVLEGNPQARAAALNLETARSRAIAARAGLFPAFSADASWSRSGSQGLPSGESYSYGFSGRQPLFSPAVTASARSASAALRSAQAAYDRTASRLTFELNSAFANIHNARETLKLSAETLRRREENLELIRLKYQAGRENKAALLETEASLKTSRWQHERYAKDLRLLERGLNRLLGRRPQEAVPGLELPAQEAPPEDLSAFEPRLTEHHALRSARAAVGSARAALDSASAARLPDAFASGGYRWSGSDWPEKRNAWSLGASASLPLFAGGRLNAGVDAARSSLASAEADLKNASDEVHLNAEDAFLSWREAWAFLDVAKSSMDAAQARAWLVRTQYLAGQASYFEWRNVEEQLISEQNQYLAAGRGLAVSGAAFAQALGE